ncbi:MAG: roadblock/LC7 domain-containing protein [Candidatus Njordarchaeia archaeon]
MATSLRKNLEKLLHELEVRDPEIQGVAIARSDGLLIADNIRTDLDKDVLSAMAASIFVIGSRSSKELSGGMLKRILIEGEKGKIVLSEIKKGILIIAVVQPDANIGLLFTEIERISKDIEVAMK